MIELLLGDCKEKLKELGDNTVDAIVTDPPYELGFMGKSWDSTGIANDKNMWAECLRVLKPGGHLLAFSGTRTYHRMASAIEDAGFEVRDMIEWVYSTGFPKSLNIGKAIDKLQGNEREDLGQLDSYRETVGSINIIKKNGTGRLTKGTSEWEGWGTALKPAHETIAVARKPFVNTNDYDILVREIITNICQLPSLVQIANKILPSNQNEQEEGVSIAQWIADENTSTQDALFVLMATLQPELGKAPNTTLSIVSSWLTTLGELLKHTSTFTTSTKISLTTDLKILNSLLAQTTQKNTTEERTEQSGDGISVSLVALSFTALKLKLQTIQTLSADEVAISRVGEQGLPPNHEPICLARKPLSGKTVAENVLKWGTGGINIDESRVGTKDSFGGGRKGTSGFAVGYEHDGWLAGNALGRFPANLIHDNSEEVRECFPEAKGCSHISKGTGNNIPSKNVGLGGGQINCTYGDNGSASRFFKSIIYQAKASKSERNNGCEGLEERQSVGGGGGIGEYLSDVNSASGKFGSEKAPAKNNHPTVKPIALMEYLIKMVTPKGGTVFDPFMGSGTTGVAAKNLNRNFIGIEMDEEYMKIAKSRIENASITPENLELFSQE